ncbi:MAG TPA: ATP-dependent helicase [Solirubrobacteraceae bacterium]|nr:ATP-dependent helicase [Solirubrobacteraceae bacterium]
MRALSGMKLERLTGWDLADPGSPPAAAEHPAARAARPQTLTDEQEQAVARRGEPLLLAAGAGSGKTSVLVERFVRAVREDGIAPERILAITFTELAGSELRERVRARLLALDEPRAARAIEEAYVGTFHGFCARVLRESGRETGLQEELEILDEGVAGRLRRQAFALALAELLEGGRGEAVDLIAAYTADRARATVLGVYAQLRSRGQRAPRLLAPVLGGGAGAGEEPDARDVEAAAAIALWDELLERFGSHYAQAKARRNGLDFDDLELRAGELLGADEHLRRAWAERFELLMVDELQDVNPRQLALVQALERENLFTVGDEWQSIYGFRHADVGLFRAREAELAPRGQSLRLAHNFRGRAELLEAVNAVFAARFGGTFIPLRAGREREREREAHGEPLVELLLSDRRGYGDDAQPGAAVGTGAVAGSAQSGAPAWREAEAQALARRVSELVRSGQTRAGGVAVLLRAVGDIECYEQALRGQGLKTLAGAGAFWARQEIADLLAYLRTLVDPSDEVALYGALAGPPVELSSDGMGLLARAAGAQERSVWEVARDWDAGRGADTDTDTGADTGTEALRDRDGAGRGGDEDDHLAGERARAERARVADRCAWLERERELMGELELSELLEREIEHGGHIARLRAVAAEDSERRVANVRKLVELAREWERSEGRDLRGFLDEAAFQAAAGGGGGRLAGAGAIAEPDAVPVAQQEQDAVRLMSVHAAKGLEFDVVCVADLGRAPSMGMPDLLVVGDAASAGGGRIGVRLIGLEDPESRPALEYAQLARERREAQAREEDRIMYVAMTRARERLLLSGAADFASWPRERDGAAPIAWLGSALVPELPVLCADAVRAGQLSTDDLAGEDRAVAQARQDPPEPAVAPTAEPAAALTAEPPSVLVLTVDGTDVPLSCRLSTPRAAGRSV